MRPSRFVLAIAALVVAAGAPAQTTYRWIDARTGKTIYSDQPPPAGARQVITSPSGSTEAPAPLPYATRRAAEKFPVTLYTAANCVEACERARALLNARGVPFAEKLLKNEDELAALSRAISAEPSVPTLFVGHEYAIGLDEPAWNNLLDLAAYPRTAPYGAKPSGAFAP